MTIFKIACQILSLLILIAIPVFYFVKFRKEKLFMKDVLWGFLLSMAASVFQKLVFVAFPNPSGSIIIALQIVSWALAGFGIVLGYLLIRKYIIKSDISKTDHLIMGFGFTFLSIVQSIPQHISIIMISISDMTGNGFDAAKNALNTEDTAQINALLTYFRDRTGFDYLTIGVSVLLTIAAVTSVLVMLMKYKKSDNDKKILIIPILMMTIFGLGGILSVALNFDTSIGLVISILVTAGISYYAYKEYKTI